MDAFTPPRERDTGVLQNLELAARPSDLVDAVITAWRLVRPDHGSRAETFSGEGARHVGGAWIRSVASAGLSVPSTVVPLERNVLLHSGHPEFERVRIDEPIGIRFDDRITSREGIG